MLSLNVGTENKILNFLKTTFLFLILILPSLTVTYFSYNRLFDQLTIQTHQERETLALQVADTVKARLDAISDVGKASANDISDLIEDGKWDEAVKEVQHVSGEFKYIDRIFLSDLEGKTLAYYPPSPENVGKDFSFRDWYKGVSKDWKPYVSEVFKRAPHPQFNTVAVMSPIKDKEGKPMGAVGFAVNLDSFYDLSNEFSIGKGGFLYIVNHKGQIVAHPKYESQGQIIDYSSAPVVQKIMNGEKGVEENYNPLENENRLSAYSVVPTYNWGVVIADPLTTAYSERDESLKYISIFFSIVVFINIVFAIVIITTIKKLRKTASDLNEANNKLKSLDKLKDEFLSIASHELRTPLTAIDGLIAMILDGDYGKVPKELKLPLQDVNLASERLIHLVNDLLNISRIRAGRLKYNLSNFSLNELTNEVITLFKAKASDKNVDLKLGEITKSTIQADKDKVIQAVSNLVGNSIKFTDKGSITLTTLEKDNFVIIQIIDTGIGISEEGKNKLFGQFQQIGNQVNRPAGTGLGLFLSRLMIQKMGGDIWLAESVEGKGSTFAISIPKVGSPEAKLASENINKEANEHSDQKSN